MKLGNSKANNKGKKYVKIKEGTYATPQNQAKADDFARWFGQWYERLQTELKQKDTYDEDILNDTFIRIYDKIRFGGIDINNYKAYFHRAFFTNFMQYVITYNQRVVPIMPDYETPDNTDCDQEVIRYKENLESDILNYVYNRYPAQQFEIFKMYVRLKPAISYAQLSQLTEIPTNTISEIIARIRRDIRRHDEFVRRRRQTLRCCEK